jgi:hypothetical protein
VRLLIATLFVFGCDSSSSYGPIRLGPHDDGPLGIELVASYDVKQTVCSDGDDPGCTDEEILPADVSSSAPDVIEVDAINFGAFALRAVSAGTANVRVRGYDDETLDLELTAAPVARTTVSIINPGTQEGVDAAYAFIDSTVQLEQRHFDAADVQLTGEAPWETSPPVEVSSDDVLSTGSTAGRITVATSFGGMATLDTVDSSAMASIEIVPSSSIEIEFSSFGSVALRASMADGTRILGGGPEPSVVAPVEVSLGSNDVVRNERYLSFDGNSPGTYAIQITWGTLTTTLNVTVR